MNEFKTVQILWNFDKKKALLFMGKDVLESSVTPYFTFNTIQAKNLISSIDGELKTLENIKIKYFTKIMLNL